MVTQWQTDRLKDKTPATPGQLLMAPSSDFYDPERSPELRQVDTGQCGVKYAAPGDRELDVGSADGLLHSIRIVEALDHTGGQEPTAP